jgi:hypothetical protein
VNDNNKLRALKIIHTVVWTFFNCIIFYLAYAVLINRIDKWIWICLSFILLEGLILLASKKICPITIIAKKYSASNKENFDIYLPNWLAKYNKEIYSTIVLVILLILIFRLFEN